MNKKTIFLVSLLVSFAVIITVVVLNKSFYSVKPETEVTKTEEEFLGIYKSKFDWEIYKVSNDTIHPFHARSIEADVEVAATTPNELYFGIQEWERRHDW